MEGRIKAILAEYRTRLEEVLGEALASVIVYGSRARGDAEQDADVDVLCVMNGRFDYGDLIEKTSAATAEISLKYGVTLSRTFVSHEDMETRDIPFLMNVRREGVAV